METQSIPHHRPGGAVPRGCVRRSVKASVGDGVFSGLSIGVVDNFTVPFALALQAAPAQIGWLTSLPPLAGALAQAWAGRLARILKERKAPLLFAVAAQGFFLLGVAALLWAPAGARIPLFTALAAGYAIFGGLAGPLWTSLLSEYLPSSKRTGFLGRRGRMTGLITVVGGLAAGMFLEKMQHRVLAGFALLFVLAGLGRWASAAFMGKFHESALSRRDMPPGSLSHFRRRTLGNPFWPFSLFSFCLIFATHLSAPYFSVYMLKRLNFSYLTFSVLTTAAAVSGVVALAFWGRLADRMGNLKVLRLSAALAVVPPFLWLLSKSPLWIFCFQVFGGFVWAGFNLCALNYAMDVAPDRLRTHAVAAIGTINGLAQFLGALLGGHLLEALPPFLGYRFLCLLLISGALRLAAVLFLGRGPGREAAPA